MSWEATNWAGKQACGLAGRKLVLLLLANWADVDGFVRFIRYDHLEKAAEMSRSVVRLRMKELEDGGALVRESGHNKDGRTISVVLNLRGSFAAPGGGSQTKSHGSDSVCEGEESYGSDSDLETKSDGSDQTKSDVSDSHLIYGNSDKNPSPTPQDSTTTDSAADCDQASTENERSSEAQDRDKALADQFQDLLRSYPVAPSMAVDEARTIFADFSIKDRGKAVRCAKIYAEDLKARGKSHPYDIANWLRKRMFDTIGEVRDAQAQAAGLPKAKVFVAMGTPAWDAWVARGHKRTLTTRDPATKNTGWWFDALYPPAVEPRAPPPKDPLEDVDFS